jgi:hypothetical protein
MQKPLVISELSEYYFYNCDKLIQLLSNKGNGNKIQYKNNGGSSRGGLQTNLFSLPSPRKIVIKIGIPDPPCY